MHTFKIGDRVRRLSGPGFFLVVAGKEYAVEGFTASGSLKLAGHRASYSADKFELVKEPVSVTDEDLANEYRTTAARLREVRKTMSDRGFALHYQGNVHPCSATPNTDVAKYYFKKVVTTIQEF